MNQNEFNAWADDYFAPETNRLNSFIPVQKLQSDFNFSTGRLFGTLKFKDYLKDWAQINGYSFNPSDKLKASLKVKKELEAETESFRSSWALVSEEIKRRTLIVHQRLQEGD